MMQEIGVYIRLKVPDHMTPAQVLEELASSIEFGNPSIELQYVLPMV
jgi:hypothetical protein